MTCSYGSLIITNIKYNYNLFKIEHAFAERDSKYKELILIDPMILLYVAHIIQLNFLIEKMVNAKLNKEMHINQMAIEYKWYN